MASDTKRNAGLSADLLKQVTAKLMEEKARLERELTRLGKLDSKTPEAGDFTTTFPDYGDSEEDNAQEVADYEANLSIERDLERNYRDVLSALQRIEKGVYGICKYCKKPIEEKRLLARPTSSSCVECKKTIVQEV